eukprot:scaffold122303_cov20-Cyclotella_meneghiniana.AAC.1
MDLADSVEEGTSIDATKAAPSGNRCVRPSILHVTSCLLNKTEDSNKSASYNLFNSVLAKYFALGW